MMANSVTDRRVMRRLPALLGDRAFEPVRTRSQVRRRSAAGRWFGHIAYMSLVARRVGA